MEKDMLFSGESVNVEYKVAVPKDSAKYMKTVVAYANGRGGKIIFGVDDKTLEVVGMDTDSIFQTIDAITNAISDSCEPTILPDITLQTVEDKTVIVVEIFPGKMRPYYIKSKGMVSGTYVRSAGTTRSVADYMLKELILEGQNRYYDCEICEELTITPEDIERLCAKMKATAIRNTLTEGEKLKVKDVTQNVLISWGVLAEKDGAVVPSNAYALLTGQARFQPVIQCAVFKGKDRAYFVDRREFEGSIQDQMEAAFQYVLEKINRGMRIQGMYRQDRYELPVDSVREMIANSVAHRSYLEPGNIQVALFDDRLEVTSPGMLLNGVSIKKMKEGYSKPRNRAIASAFAYMKIIEKWGSGIPRILRECNEYGLPEPEFIDFDGDFRVNMYRQLPEKDWSHTDDTKRDTNDTISENDTKVLNLIRENPSITQAELKEKLQVSIVTVKRLMADLQKRGLIERQGSSRKGKWIIIGQKE
jgi:predicted HTH transcriptional regulator